MERLLPGRLLNQPQGEIAFAERRTYAGTKTASNLRRHFRRPQSGRMWPACGPRSRRVAMSLPAGSHCLPGRDIWRISRAKSNRFGAGNVSFAADRPGEGPCRPSPKSAAFFMPSTGRLLRHPQSRSTSAARATFSRSALRRWRRPAPARHGDWDWPTTRSRRDAMLAHIRTMVEATDLPVNADFGNGFADDPEGVAEMSGLCSRPASPGCRSRTPSGAATDALRIDLAVERVAAARAAIDATGADVILMARAEACRFGHPERLDEAIRRLSALPKPGADCLYAPGVRARAESRRWSRRWRRSRSMC